jgi:hypothetical protein
VACLLDLIFISNSYRDAAPIHFRVVIKKIIFEIFFFGLLVIIILYVNGVQIIILL